MWMGVLRHPEASGVSVEKQRLSLLWASAAVVVWKKMTPKGSGALGGVALLEEVSHCGGGL